MVLQNLQGIHTWGDFYLEKKTGSKGDSQIQTTGRKLTNWSGRAPPTGGRCTLQEALTGEGFLLLSPEGRAWKGSGLTHDTLPFTLMPQKNILIFFRQRRIILYKSVPPPLSLNLDKVDLIPPEKFANIQLPSICNQAQIEETPLSYIKRFWISQKVVICNWITRLRKKEVHINFQTKGKILTIKKSKGDCFHFGRRWFWNHIVHEY